MKESRELLLSEKTLDALCSRPDTVEQILFAELVEKVAEIEALIAGYHFSSRGRVFGLAIDPGSFRELGTGTWGFSLTYNVGIFQACADIDSHYSEKMRVLLEFQPEGRTVLLSGEEIPEREPDEI